MKSTSKFLARMKYATLPLILFALMACSDTTPESAESVSTTAATTNATSTTTEQSTATTPYAQSYVVGIDANYPPYDFKDENGNAQGFDVDIIRAIAENQGFGVDVLPQDWDVLIKGIDDAQSHIAMSGFYKSEERKEKYLVSDTYAWGRDAIAVRENEDGIRVFKDLGGRSVATLADSPYIAQLEEVSGKGSPNIIGRSSAFLAFKELAMGNAEAVLAEEGVLLYYAKQFPEVKFKLVGEGDGFEPYEMTILTPKSETELMEKINAGLANIVADGTYATIYEKWFGRAPTQLPASN